MGTRRLKAQRLATALLAWLWLPAWAADAIVLATGVGPPFATPRRDGFLDRIVAEAFRRAGSAAEVRVTESSERALINANNGIDDGVVPRIKGLEAQYPNLVRIPEKVFDNDFVAQSLRHDFATPDWQSLAPYDVAYPIGWKIFELHLDTKRDAVPVKGASQLFSLLQQNRTDVILYERWQGLWQARELGLAINTMEPPLARQEMYAYLHKKHAAVVPKAAEALAAMKRDGTYQAIFDATLTPLARPRGR